MNKAITTGLNLTQILITFPAAGTPGELFWPAAYAL